ncbi:DUF3558 family protein [Gordonia aquimaris]|uniref:DUF3558 family protein n=1 Tax=Gordonia aquimaris TaxID=2984863 RepID=A0A9X3D1Y4_9ACTN|nr:DUF3558 family protein [Gordonia aquimaris]MCX2963169.1 DUF3558 family protein [Gordonia aquimaris]
MRTAAKASVTAVATLIALTIGACGDSSPDDASQATDTPAASTETQRESPTTLTGQDMCAVLTDDDLAPLRDGAVTNAPEPTDDRGLPGCEWPLSDGYGELKVEVFQPVDATVILENAVLSEYPIAGGTVYQQTEDGQSSCRALVKTADTPDGFLLRVLVDGDADDGSVCRSAIPQTEKVLQALGW